MKNKIIVKENKINILKKNNETYISLSDIAKTKSNYKRAADIIKNWLRNRNTIEFLGAWEQLYNNNFKVVEFDHFKKYCGLNTFTLSISEWIDKTNAIGFIVKKGKYGNTYAHPDIAFEFASAISPIFKLYLIKEFERLKQKENNTLNQEWIETRLISKANYLIQTDAISNFIIPKLSDKQKRLIYASEADVLNVALFGMTAKEWREKNKELSKKGNIRDFTDILHLIILSNLENLNAVMIKNGLPQKERLIKLNKNAKQQVEILKNNQNIVKITTKSLTEMK